MDSINRNQPEKNREHLYGRDAIEKIKQLVDKAENCFPMVPSGAAHNEMILADDKPKDPTNASVTEEGMALV